MDGFTGDLDIISVFTNKYNFIYNFVEYKEHDISYYMKLVMITQIIVMVLISIMVNCIVLMLIQLSVL